MCVLLFAFNLGYEIYLEQYFAAAKIALTLLIGFIFVSGAREIINAPRPYELYSFYDTKPKERSGRSFPSRHAYSAFAIATAAFSVHTALAASFLFLALIMCAARVLTGIHFIRDVLCGALLGTASGVLALLLI